MLVCVGPPIQAHQRRTVALVRNSHHLVVRRESVLLPGAATRRRSPEMRRTGRRIMKPKCSPGTMRLEQERTCRGTSSASSCVRSRMSSSSPSLWSHIARLPSISWLIPASSSCACRPRSPSAGVRRSGHLLLWLQTKCITTRRSGKWPCSCTSSSRNWSIVVASPQTMSRQRQIMGELARCTLDCTHGTRHLERLLCEKTSTGVMNEMNMATRPRNRVVPAPVLCSCVRTRYRNS